VVEFRWRAWDYVAPEESLHSAIDTIVGVIGVAGLVNGEQRWVQQSIDASLIAGDCDPCGRAQTRKDRSGSSR